MDLYQGVGPVPMGFGCADLSAEPRDDERYVDLLRAVADAGVRLFDTSESYGSGHNEELIRRALGDRRDEILLSTKFGQVWRPDGTRFVDARPERVRGCCEASLERLGTDVIDLYYLHRVDPAVPVEETVGAMAELVEAGLVRSLGISEVSPATLQRAHDTHPIAALQTEYSLMFRDPEVEIIPLCERLGTTFVAYSPLGIGFLSGAFRRVEDLAGRGRGSQHGRMSPENLAHNARLLGALEDEADAIGCTNSQLALAWVLHRTGPIVPIPGTRSTDHLAENIAAADIELDPQTVARLDEVFHLGAVRGERKAPEGMELIDGAT